MNEEPKLTEGDNGRVRVFCTMLNIPIPQWAMSDTDKPEPDTNEENKNEQQQSTQGSTYS